MKKLHRRDAIRNLLRDIRAQGYDPKCVYDSVLSFPEIVISYKVGQGLPVIRPQRYQHRGSPREIKNVTLGYTFESVESYVESRIPHERIVFDRLPGCMPYYDNFEVPTLTIDPFTAIGETRTMIYAQYSPYYAVNRIKWIVRKKDLKDWWVFMPIAYLTVGALIFLEKPEACGF